MASPVVDKAKERVGQVLREKWRLEKLLGVGGSAAVYQATHVNNGKRAAVKMLHTDLSTNKEVVTRFLKEGYFSNQVDHPGAVSVIDDDRAEDGSVYLVMELLEGHSLERYVRGKERLDTRQVLDFVDQVLDLLAVAHQKGILHRDIKPANVFLTKEGKIKVLDFGIARLHDPQGDQAPMTQTGTGIGTPSYMPPEQARGRWSQVDARTDLFAVGAMMYALLTGVRPRKAETGNEELLLAMTQPMPKLQTALPDVDPSIAEIVDRACEFDMDKRWPTARVMQQAIRMHGKPVADDPDTDARSLPRQSRNDWADVTSADALARALPQPDDSREPSHVTKDPIQKDPSHVTKDPQSIATPSQVRSGTGSYAVPRVIPDGPRFKVPQLKRSADTTTSSAPPSAAVPPPPSGSVVVPEPPPRSGFPSLDVDVDASPPPPPMMEASPSRVSARKPFSSPVAWLSLALEPQLGFLLVGAHGPEGEPPRLRAYDFRRGVVVWEALRGQPWVKELRDIRVLGAYVLVVHRQIILALDLRTGQQLWTAQLPEKPEYKPGGEDRGPAIFDFTAQSGNVVVWGSKSVVALDAATGQERWRRVLPGPTEAWAVEGTPFLVMRYSSGARGALEILHAQAPEPVASFGTQWFTDEASVVSAHVEGGRVAARVENWGLLMGSGVLVIDAATQRQIGFERAKEIDTAFWTIPGPNGAYYVSGGVLVGPGGRKGPPPAGYRYAAFKLAGASIIAVLEEEARARSYRMIVLDVATLRPRHDLGPVAPPGQRSVYLPRDPNRYVLVAGEYLVFSALVAAGTEMRCVHAATGQTLWSQPRQEATPVDDAFLMGGMVVLRSAEAVELIDPSRGMIAGRYG